MEKLNFDNGLKRFQINGDAVLEFNPSDMNVYARFLEAAEKIAKVENDLVARGEKIDINDGQAVIRLMAEADKETKNILRYVFGEQNDFEKIFGGVNVMAVASNGERVITNFLEAIAPIIMDGAKSYAEAKAAGVAGKVKQNRAQRRKKK